MEDESPAPVEFPRTGPPGEARFGPMYATPGFTPPWDIGRPQAAFQRIAAEGALAGTVLDIGCGTGEHALMAASLGHVAVGIDDAPEAIERATAKAAERGITARFVIWDALELAALGEQFDTVLDCGLFHVFEDAERVAFVRSLAAAMPAGGHYYMLCFSDRQPGSFGPRRVTQAEIRSSFAEGWDVEAIDPAVMEITISPDGAQAWLATIART
jgi:cyclopropane fatty-acyl-phospholipid synthase-like methyltransferase